jgi:hypothetical protein
MFLPCPHCQFLVAHHPQLRPMPAACPQCGKPLDGPGGEDPTQGGQEATQVDADAQADASADSATMESALTGIGAEPVQAESAPDTAADSAIQAGGNENAPRPPSGAATPSPASPSTPAWATRLPRWQWPAVIALALLLPLQALLADRHRLAADPAWRPALQTLCGLLGCELPAWRAPEQFRMLHSQMRRAAGSGALRMDATFRNDARWEQPWPSLQLALADADGRTVGSSVLAPAQYLGQTPTTALAPGQSAQITFVVREPAPGTVGFSLRFR